MNLVDTIVAVATPPGRGGIGIVRISGPQALIIAEQICKASLLVRQAQLVSFYNQHDEVLDEGLALFFKDPHSFTGEDVVELQGHGSPVVLDLLLQVIVHYGARLARPGEFSERAFLNDKIDLVQAEAIADLIDASTQLAARSALHSLQGEFSKQINDLVESLIYLRTFLEATLDFPEEDVEFVEREKVIEQLTQILEALQLTLASAQTGVILRDGLNVLILGRPNAGKSSLLNLLAKNEVAIVSEVPGTTRDLIKETVSIVGVPLHVIDTAGLRESADVIEQEGIRRARASVQKADLVLWVVDASECNEISDEYMMKELKSLLGDTFDFVQSLPFVIILNKIDLIKIPENLSEIKLHFNSQEKMVSLVKLAARYAQGFSFLESAILKVVGLNKNDEHHFIARRRHLEALRLASQHLMQGLIQYREHKALELLAEDCRLAQEALSEITGVFRSDDLLGRIFSSFCIGK